MPNTITAAGEAMPTELPVDKVQRLAADLSKALVAWTGGSYMALVYPEGDNRGYWFRHIKHAENATDAFGKLRSLAHEAGSIVAMYPELNIERIAVNEHGVHTFLRTPGVPPRGPIDPLLSTILEYRSGLERLNELKSLITPENEDRLVGETYGPYEEKLMKWDTPAVTVEGAIEALKLMEESDVFIDTLGEKMSRAVLSFLEGLRA